jgi:DNA-binding NarL/FixJ family response regulator
MIKVLIADDHSLFIEGLLALISKVEGISISGTATNGRTALELIREIEPDVAVLDISMPELTGLEIIEALRGSGIATKFIIVTMHASPTMAEKVLKLGASGYLLKENAFSDLLYAIRTVGGGGTFITPSIAGNLFEYGSKDNSGRLLSPREKEVISLIASGLTNRQIAEKLFVSIKTVDTHRMRIMGKLGLHTTADLVRYAMQRGLF